jgi:hypothetical protein
MGSGLPLAARVSAGGVGIGRGLPLVPRANRGGVGIGSGLPLALRASTGGVGIGRGLPLTLRASAGGVGIGSGLPLGAASETATPRLLDKCLTEPLTGSTIEPTKASTARYIEMFFFMSKSLLMGTMEAHRQR